MKKKVIIGRLLILSIILLLFVCVVSGCSTYDPELKETLETIQTGLENDLTEYGITDYTFDREVVPDGNDYKFSVEVPELDSYDDEKKCDVLYNLCGNNDGFYSSEGDFIMINVYIISNEKTYCAYNQYEYFVDGEMVSVNQRKNSSSGSSSNKWAGRNYDYDGDNQWDDNEWYDAMDDYLDEYGY